MTQKAFRLVTDDSSAMVRIEYEGGGEVPAELDGMYTDTATAQKAIAAYNAAKGVERVVKDKTI